MSLENEVIGEINKEIFTSKKIEFTKSFGEPSCKKRLGLMVFDRNNPDVDTRVRITNGKAEVMQKILKNEDGQGHYKKDEISFDINSSVDDIFNAFLTYTNLLQEKYSNGLIRLLVQTENYIWKVENYELKISYQFGKNDYYTFEIEAINEKCDVKQVQSQLGLIPTENHASKERKEFRATQVDLNANEMSLEEVRSVIKNYI
jgi:hypothetical protein